MKYTAIAMLLLVAGCAASSLEEAYYTDRDFGEAQRSTFDRQIAYPESPYKNNPVVGQEGIHAESIMKTTHETFSEKPAPPMVLELGVAEQN